MRPSTLTRVAGAPFCSREIFAVALLVVTCGNFSVNLAAAQEAPATNNQIQLYATPDDSSVAVESIQPGDALAPVGEMIGAGGAKWYMVRTKTGMIGWIKAGEGESAKKIANHFKSLPNESAVLPSNLKAGASGAPAEGPITIPVNARGSQVIVPVTFNGTVTARLLLDTGAGKTMISKRIAKDLRLFSLGPAVRYGIGGAITVATAKVETVRVGAAEVANMEVSIYDFSPDPGIEGLLGFDFLRFFNVSIDTQRQLLVLTPRKS